MAETIAVRSEWGEGPAAGYFDPVRRTVAVDGHRPGNASPPSVVLGAAMEDTDADLVGRARDGDRDAFEQLVRRHLSAAIAVALAILNDSDDARDVAQDALVTSLTQLDDLTRGEAFRGWLLRIVRNRALDRRRSATRFPKVDAAAADLVEARDGPDGEAARGELRERLHAAMATLPEVEREVLLLHDLEGWKHREIGEKLGMLEGTVRHTLFRARKRMRAQLGSLEENRI